MLKKMMWKLSWTEQHTDLKISEKGKIRCVCQGMNDTWNQSCQWKKTLKCRENKTKPDYYICEEATRSKFWL